MQFICNIFQIKLSLRKPTNTHKLRQSGNSPNIISTCSGLLTPKLINANEEQWNDLSAIPHVALYLTLGTSEMTDSKVLHTF